MKFNKFVAPIMAGALTLSLGLVACGGSSESTSTETTEETTEATTETTEATDAAATEEDTVLFWSGDTDKGDILLYAEDDTDDTACIILFGDHDDTDELLAFSGPAKLDGNTVTITDSETNDEFSFDIEDGNADDLTIDLGEHGKGTIKPVTEKQFNELVDSIVNAVKEIGDEVSAKLETLDEQDVEELLSILESVLDETAAEQATK